MCVCGLLLCFVAAHLKALLTSLTPLLGSSTTKMWGFNSMNTISLILNNSKQDDSICEMVHGGLCMDLSYTRCSCTCVSPKISVIITDLSECAPANLQVSLTAVLTIWHRLFFLFFYGGVGGLSAAHTGRVLACWSYDTPPPVPEKANRPIEQCCLNNKTH